MTKLTDIIKNPKYYLILLYGKIIPKSLKWDEKYVKKMYKYKMNEELNLKKPQTYSEKLQWLKLYDRNPIYTKMVDKYEVKDYVSKIIGDEYIIPTLGVWDKFDDIDFNSLPNQFVLKCTHDSGGLVIVTDKKNFDKKAAKTKINHCLKRNYYTNTREWPYKGVKPRIIAEPYLEDKELNEIRDYKFFIFNNKHVMTLVCSDRLNKVKYTFFDVRKKLLDIKQCCADNDPNVKLPNNYAKMVDFAERLSKDTIQVRVDFYEINNEIYFGELTFFDSSGFGKFSPEEWDYKLGKLIELEDNNEISKCYNSDSSGE